MAAVGVKRVKLSANTLRSQAVATRFLGDIEMDDKIRVGCIEMCQEFHVTTMKLSDRYLAELERHNYVTPTSYLEMINTFKLLLDNKRSQVIKVAHVAANSKKISFCKRNGTRNQAVAGITDHTASQQTI